jgi:hypothetical protein
MNRQRAIIIVMVSILAMVSSRASSDAPLAQPRDILLHAEYFSVWGCGAAPMMSENERTFRAFMQQKPEAYDALKLIADGTPAGKIYGFLALRDISPDLFRTLSPRFIRSRIEVPAREACSQSKMYLGNLFRDISVGKVNISQQRE